jgi:hypothetical protein
MARPKKPKKPKPPKYTWILSQTGVLCYSDPAGGQQILPLWEADSLSPFHDETLAKATREINAIFNELAEAKPSEDVELSFIEFQDRPFMVWSSYDAISQYDDDEVVIDALGLKKAEADWRKRD